MSMARGAYFVFLLPLYLSFADKFHSVRNARPKTYGKIKKKLGSLYELMRYMFRKSVTFLYS